MQLKDGGSQVVVSLTKPERKLLEKARDKVNSLSLLPCAQQGLAKDAKQALEGVLGSFEEKDN